MSNPIPRGRHSIRLKGYNYSSSGLYDITICTHRRHCIFGDIEKEKMILNKLGNLVNENWENIIRHWSHIDHIEYGVMPNHLHGIIVIKGKGLTAKGTINRAPTNKIEAFGKPNSGSVPSIIGAFKAGVTRQVGKSSMRELYGPIWQRGYYEHIIRSEAELLARIKYIRDNPRNWEKDIYYRPNK